MKTRHEVASNGHIHEFSEQEAIDLFDARARYYLNIPGDAFLTQWRAGEFADRDEDPNVIAVAMLLPLVDQGARQAGR